MGAARVNRTSAVSSSRRLFFSSFADQRGNFSDLWRRMDSLRQPTTFRSIVGQRRSSEAFPKADVAPKKGHGDCLVVSRRFHTASCSRRDRRSGEVMWGEELVKMQQKKLHWIYLALINRKGVILLPMFYWWQQKKLIEMRYETSDHPLYLSYFSPIMWHISLSKHLHFSCKKPRHSTTSSSPELLNFMLLDYLR